MIDINRYYNTYPYYGGYMDYNMMGSCFCNKSYFRVLNTLDEPLDVHVNDILMGENLNIGEFTRYIKFPTGTYHILITEENGKLLYESDIDIDFNLVYTGVISVDNDTEDICVLMVPEEKEYHMTGNMSELRLANLSVDVPDFILLAVDGTVLFSDIKYGKVSCNIAIPSGRYILYLKTPDGNNILEYNMDIAPKMHYTLFMVGKYKDKSIKIIVPEDGVNYLDLC